MYQSHVNLRRKFWALVSISIGDDKCWPFQQRYSENGYGWFWDGKRTRGAHRVAWEFEYGKIPEGLIVMHSCDNPCCCNLSHLSIGTKKDNTVDMVKKNRHAHGTKSPHSVLTEKDIIMIRNDPRKYKYIAPDYNISISNVSTIKTKKTWKHT